MEKKLEQIKALAEKITKNKERINYEARDPETFDFTYGGNFDDAYMTGFNEGELDLAFDILDILKADTTITNQNPQINVIP